MIGQCRFGRQLPLGPDAGVHLSLRPSVLALEPLPLHLGTGGDHHHRIHQLLGAHLQHHRWQPPRAPQPVHVLLHRPQHLRVDDRLQLPAFRRVREDHRGQAAPVDGLVLVEHLPAEHLNDPAPSQPLGLNRLMRHRIGVEHHRTQRLEHPGDGAFAGAEPSRQPNDNH